MLEKWKNRSTVRRFSKPETIYQLIFSKKTNNTIMVFMTITLKKLRKYKSTFLIITLLEHVFDIIDKRRRSQAISKIEIKIMSQGID